MEAVVDHHRIRYWPSPQDYNEAIQNPHYSLFDPTLKNSVVVADKLGLPKPVSGAFATVYQVISEERSWAVRCFLRGVDDQEERYRAVARHLLAVDIPELIAFDFQPAGMKIQGQTFPILKMEWVTGQTLEHYIGCNINDRARLTQLRANFRKMCENLSSAGVCHGDLQHGNIIVQADARLSLVDYDGMYVPAMEGWCANELGHRNYQHPHRTADDFGPWLDCFASRVIDLSLEAIIEDPYIFPLARAGNDCLLFRRQDFENVDRSQVFAQLDRMSASVQESSRALKWLIHSRPMTPLGLEQLAPLQIPCHFQARSGENSRWYQDELPSVSEEKVDRLAREVKVRSRSCIESELVASRTPRKLARSSVKSPYKGLPFSLDPFWLLMMLTTSSSYLQAIVLGAIGLIIATHIISWYFGVERRVLSRGVATTARVQKTGGGADRCLLIYEFRLNDARKTLIKSDPIACSEDIANTIKDGETVTILYDPVKPDHNFIYKLSRYRVVG